MHLKIGKDVVTASPRLTLRLLPSSFHFINDNFCVYRYAVTNGDFAVS